MDSSILISIKKLLGIEQEYTHFDPDIIIAINSALMALNQMGIGPSIGFMITNADEQWSDFIGDRKDLESIKTYIYLKSKLMFDPPTNSFLVEAIERQLKEYEWRINIQAEQSTEQSTVEGGIING
jgi:hypothetical protein